MSAALWSVDEPVALRDCLKEALALSKDRVRSEVDSTREQLAKLDSE